MQLSFAIDWVSMTIPDGLSVSYFPTFAFGYEQGAWKPVSPKNGYKSAIRHPYGMVMMWNVDRPDMGVHMMISGASLKELSHDNVSGLQIVKWAVDHRVSITRLDLAIDAKDVQIDIPSLVRMEQRKSNAGRKKKIGVTQEVGGGCTAYIGSRTSDKFMRIYDKAAERGLTDGTTWTRFELELKGKTARGVASLLAEGGMKKAFKFTQGAMKGHFNVVDPVYEAIMQNDAIMVTTEKNVDHDRMNWLMGTVAKSIAKTMTDLPHIDVWTLLQERVEQELKQLGW